jgi:hypothetical protein
VRSNRTLDQSAPTHLAQRHHAIRARGTRSRGHHRFARNQEPSDMIPTGNFALPWVISTITAHGTARIIDHENRTIASDVPVDQARDIVRAVNQARSPAACTRALKSASPGIRPARRRIIPNRSAAPVPMPAAPIAAAGADSHL